MLLLRRFLIGFAAVAMLITTTFVLVAGCGPNGGQEQQDLCEGVDCDDGNECTSDECEPSTGQCSNRFIPNDTACHQGQGVCRGGVCEIAPACEGVVCNDNNPCTTDTCNPASGSCDYASLPDGAACDFSGLAGRCVSAVCTAVSPPNVFLSAGGSVMSSSRHRMEISVGGPVGHGLTSSPNFTLELHLPVNQ